VNWLFFVALIFSTTQAQEIIRKNDRLFLKTNTCSEGAAVVGDLDLWLKTSTPKKCITTYQQNQFCEHDITECVPEHVKRYQGVHASLRGPNCWNLALVMSQILPNLRYSDPEEISFYMQPPLCNSVPSGEKRSPGDIGLIRNVDSEKIGFGPKGEVHGFIYINNDLVYSKNGLGKENPYAIQSAEKMYSEYPLTLNSECHD
jgi:hypothetical protein